MSNKKITLILLIVMLFLLSGCVSVSNREKILKELKNENYIKSNWNYIETNYAVTNSILFDVGGYEYIYQDSDNILYNVSIPNELEDEFYIKIYSKVYKTEINNPYKDKEKILVYEQEKDAHIDYITLEKKETKLLWGLITFEDYSIK